MNIPKSFLFFLFPLLCFFWQIIDFGEAKKPKAPIKSAEFRVDSVAKQNAHKFGGLGKCAFFCFYVPLNDNETVDTSFYKQISCSDIVYGFAQIKDYSLEFPTKRDLLANHYYGNFKLITSLKHISTAPQVHLGMKMAPDSKFLLSENVELTSNVTRRMVFYTRRYGFNGIFLKFESDLLLIPGFELFIELLSKHVKTDREEHAWAQQPLRLVLSISSKWARYVYRRMPKFNTHFDVFYLWADETDSATRVPMPKHAIPVDPLHSTKEVPHFDSLAVNAERLVGTGVSPQKIIIGLNAWTRSYVLYNQNDTTTMPTEILDYGIPGEKTRQPDGKLAFQEICSLLKNQLFNYDNQSETLSLRYDGLWYSFNEPEHIALQNKLNWISNHEFGGIGLYSFQADDPTENCSRGILPLHQSVANHFKCRRRTKRGNVNQNGECTRLCILDMDRVKENTFDFDALKPGWCSHLVVARASVNLYIQQGLPSKGMQIALEKYNEWQQERKPYLILSFSGHMEQWRMATFGTNRFMLIERIRRLLEEHNADGVELNCENGGPDGTNQAYQMSQFLSDLRRILGSKKQILLTLHPSSFLNWPNYDFPTMIRAVDYIVAVGYRFHRYTNSHTGHHSPMFRNNTMLNQPHMTIEGVIEYMLGANVPKEKLIMALSAEAMAQHFADDIYNHRTWEQYEIGGAASVIHSRSRLNGIGVVSQTDVCEYIKKNNTITHFLNELGVPYIVSNRHEYIAYDNKQSIQIKTVWISLRGLAGIALHGLEMDNIHGICPAGESFPLLKTIVQSQVCTRCNLTLQSALQSTTTVVASEWQTTTPGDSAIKTMVTESTMTGEVTTKKENVLEKDSAEESGTQLEINSELLASTTTASNRNILLSSDAHYSSCRTTSQDIQQQQQHFQLFCSLPLASIEKNITLKQLPLDRCDAILLTDWAKLDGEGNTEWTSEDGNDETFRQLTEMAYGNGTALWAEVSFGMNASEWEDLVNTNERRELAAKSLSKLLTKKNLTGLLLDCDSLMRPSCRIGFSQLLNELNAELLENGTIINSNDNDSKCISRVALRFQLSRTNLSEVYVLEQLNKLLRYVLLPVGVSVTEAKTKLMNPLFALSTGSEIGTLNTQNITIFNWIFDGLNPSLILQELSAYGIYQTRENKEASKLVTQKEVCQFIRKPGVMASTRYDAVAAYWTTRDEWLSAEKEEIIKYKVRFSIQHHLGGIMLNSLDADDPQDVCKSGKDENGFPLFNAIYEARCEGQKANKKLRMERDMLNTMVFSRGRR